MACDREAPAVLTIFDRLIPRANCPRRRRVTFYHWPLLDIPATRSTKKSQIQALDRTQLGLLIKPGRCQTLTHDYKRHGTTTLFAALSVLDGRVIGRCMQRHRHCEFIRFLNAVEREAPAGKLIHAVLDNYATHKHPRVLAWLSRHPRWTFHFTPTSASWLNAVETFFAKLTRQRIRRGVFRSIVDLQSAINAYLAEHNAHPKPLVWTKSAEAILAKLDRIPVPSCNRGAGPLRTGQHSGGPLQTRSARG
jgi:transposase